MMLTAKVGVSRQIVIPKRLFDQLGLAPGDFLEVTLRGGSLVMTPKTLVDKPLESAPGRPNQA
jgi:AbrB family looped-hinge helix DNA binding protein